MTDLANFLDLVGERLDRDLHDQTADALLGDDLGFDSLSMAEVLVLFADHGINLPEDLLPELRTVGDLHHYFEVRVEPRGAPAPHRLSHITIDARSTAWGRR